MCVSIFSFVVDDAYISFLYARNLVEYQQLVPSHDNFVQGYTNFLFVLIATLFYVFTGSSFLEPAMKLFLVLCGCSCISLLGAILFRLKISVPLTLCSLIGLATSTPFIVWTMGGLETIFLSALFMSALYVALFLPHRFSLLCLLTLLATLTRWDSICFMVPLLCGRLFSGDERPAVLSIKFGSLFLIPFGLYLWWVKYYYGVLLPQSFVQKASKTFGELAASAFLNGSPYFLSFLLINFHWLCLAGLFSFLINSRKVWNRPDDIGSMSVLRCCAAGLLIYFGYIISQGAPHMTFTFRLYTPLVPVLMLYLALGLHSFLVPLTPPSLKLVGILLGTILLTTNLATFGYAYYRNMIFSPFGNSDYSFEKNASIRGWIEFSSRLKQAAVYFDRNIPPTSKVFAWGAGIFPFYLRGPVYDGALIGFPPDGHIDYEVNRCDCQRPLPESVWRRYPDGLGQPYALYYPLTSACLVPRELREGFTVWNNPPNLLLHWSILGGNGSEAESLLNQGAEAALPDIWGNTPLMYAATTGHVKIGHLLLRHGAGVNAANHLGLTALHFAANKGHYRMVRMLLAHGADANLSKTVFTPLAVATLRGHDEVTQLLRQSGARAYLRFSDESGLVSGYSIALLVCALILAGNILALVRSFRGGANLHCDHANASARCCDPV